MRMYIVDEPETMDSITAVTTKELNEEYPGTKILATIMVHKAENMIIASTMEEHLNILRKRCIEAYLNDIKEIKE